MKAIPAPTILALAALLTCACSSVPPTTKPAIPAAPPPQPLPAKRHGHRIERLPGGYLCFGGFGRGAGRGTKTTLYLSDDQRVGNQRVGDQRAWQPRAGLTQGQAFASSTSWQGSAIAIGAAVERYDPASGAWRVLVAPGQLPGSHFSAARIGPEIFVMGGFPKVGTGFAIVDLSHNTVTAAAPPPSYTDGDHLHVVHNLRGELHVMGGFGTNGLGMLQAHWVRRDGRWQRLPDCPAGLWSKFAAQAVVGDCLYLFGDFGAYCYDPAAEHWQPLAKLPALLAMPATIVQPGGDAIWALGGLALGGLAQGGKSPTCWRYEIGTDRWSYVARNQSGP